MYIHVVMPGETISSIAELYNISVTSLIRDNDISNPEILVPGQTLVIVYPEQTYTVKEGDTLESIANSFNIPVMQLLRNNPYITDLGYLPIGDSLVISYNTNGRIATNGYAFPNIDKTTLRKTLPYLTYISIFNYRLARKGEITADFDDSEIIQISKNYGVAPLMLVTSLTPEGESNVELIYEVLLNPEFQDRFSMRVIDTLKSKGYYGIIISMHYLSVINLTLYETFIKRFVNTINTAGYQVFLNISPNLRYVRDSNDFQKINYTNIAEPVTGINFMDYVWPLNSGAPVPIISYTNLSAFLNYADQYIDPAKINVGIQTFGYDWELSFVAGITTANLLSIEQAINLAYSKEVTIQFDEVSQTPFYQYTSNDSKTSTNHIVWFIDARTIEAILNLVTSSGYNGISVWNIMEFYSALWLIINSQLNIDKVI
jgi:spore germination protein